jgi:hypothetical protein
VGVAVALLVFVAVVGRWMLTPFDDWVPLDAPEALPAGVDPNALPKSAMFRCSAPVGEVESAVASPQATEALELQVVAREPCAGPRSLHRAIGTVDLAVAGAGLLVVVLAARRREPAVEPDGTLDRRELTGVT